jgi:hypothetical protein
MVETESRKAALIAEIEVSRGELRRALLQCEANLEPALLVRNQVRKAPALWLSGAALTGLALSKLVPGRRDSRHRGFAAAGGAGFESPGEFPNGGKKQTAGGWFGSVCRVAFDLFRPVIADWANQQLAGLARGWMMEQRVGKTQAKGAPGDGKKG